MFYNCTPLRLTQHEEDTQILIKSYFSFTFICRWFKGHRGLIVFA